MLNFSKKYPKVNFRAFYMLLPCPFTGGCFTVTPAMTTLGPLMGQQSPVYMAWHVLTNVNTPPAGIATGGVFKACVPSAVFF